MSRKGIDRLVQEFAEGARRFGAEYQLKDATASADRILNAFLQLTEYGDRGRDALMVLLKDPDPEVRTQAATFLLRHCTAEAKAVLEAAARDEGMLGFSAQQSLERWKEGSWSLDPEPATRGANGSRRRR